MVSDLRLQELLWMNNKLLHFFFFVTEDFSISLLASDTEEAALMDKGVLIKGFATMKDVLNTSFKCCTVH